MYHSLSSISENSLNLEPEEGDNSSSNIQEEDPGTVSPGSDDSQSELQEIVENEENEDSTVDEEINDNEQITNIDGNDSYSESDELTISDNSVIISGNTNEHDSGSQEVTYVYETVYTESSQDVPSDLSGNSEMYLGVICSILLFFTVVCICRYIYKFFNLFF